MASAALGATHSASIDSDWRGVLIVARSAATAVDLMETQIPGRGPRWAGRD